MSETLFSVTIPHPVFSEYLLLSQKRAVKPFLQQSKTPLPKKYQNDSYAYNVKGKLVEVTTGEVVASNPTLVGTPRYLRINTQGLYNGAISPMQRKTVVSKLHAIYEPYFKDIIIDEFPVQIFLHFYVLDSRNSVGKEKNLDNSNRWLYLKIIEDCMVAAKTLPDDSTDYTNDCRFKTTYVDTIEETKLVVSLINL